MDVLQYYEVERKNMIYLTSDIHGCFKEFKKMLEYLNFGPEDYLYIIGDAVDRGPEPIPLFQFIMRQPNMELLMGNHEQGFLWNVYKMTVCFQIRRFVNSGCPTAVRKHGYSI